MFVLQILSVYFFMNTANSYNLDILTPTGLHACKFMYHSPLWFYIKIICLCYTVKFVLIPN